jgi:putative endonuclease
MMLISSYMTEKRLKLGREGGNAAEAYLKKKGYRIIEKNFRCKLGEIDIIADPEWGSGVY